MLVPTQSEKLQVCSAVIQDELLQLHEEGIPYYSDRAAKIAAHAVMTFVPELSELARSTVLVEASQAVSIDNEDSLSFSGGIHVAGVLRSVQIQQVIEEANFEGIPLSSIRFDLCAVLTPKYIDPDPVDIIFGKELYVPFGAITEFAHKG